MESSVLGNQSSLLSSLFEKMAVFEKQLGENQERVSTAEATAKATELANLALKKDYTQISHTCEQLQVECSKLREQQTDLTTRNQELERNLEFVKEQFLVNEEKRKKTKDKNAALKVANNELQQKVLILSSELTSFETINNELQKELLCLKQTVEDNQQLQQEHETLKTSMKDLTTSTDKSMQLCRTLIAQCSAQRAALAEKEEEIAKYKVTSGKAGKRTATEISPMLPINAVPRSLPNKGKIGLASCLLLGLSLWDYMDPIA